MTLHATRRKSHWRRWGRGENSLSSNNVASFPWRFLWCLFVCICMREHTMANNCFCVSASSCDSLCVFSDVALLNRKTTPLTLTDKILKFPNGLIITNRTKLIYVCVCRGVLMLECVVRLKLNMFYEFQRRNNYKFLSKLKERVRRKDGWIEKSEIFFETSRKQWTKSINKWTKWNRKNNYFFLKADHN